MKKLALAAALAVAATSCKTADPAPAPKPDVVHSATPVKAEPAPKPLSFEGPMTPGLDEAAIDPAVNPCDDFYAYSCGNWMKNTEIPADRSGWSRGFAEISERNIAVLRELLEGLAKGENARAPYAKELGDYWASCMDEAKLETSEKELKAELKKFDGLKDGKRLAPVLGKLHARDIAPLFSFYATQDAKDATQVIAQLDQGGMGLPDRDYYLVDEPKLKEVLKLYEEHVGKVFELLGQYPESAQASAKNVVALETELAKAALDKVARRDPNKVYNRINRDGLKKEAPFVPWDALFKQMGAEKVTAINVTHVQYAKAISELVKNTGPNVWKDYLTFRFVESMIPALPRRYQDERFRFTSKALTGASQDLPRWKKCVGYSDDALGEALAQPFVDKTFGADGKAKTNEMVVELEKSFEKNLGTLSWMDAETKTRALEKLKKISNKIGYPDKWKSYAGLKTTRTSFLANALSSQAYEKKRNLDKIGKPVDKSEWLMTPPTVNAYYEPSKNEIVFPAGILQPPFFNREATFPVNFGAMGMVVGHEITHGFDDEGRQYDGNGNLTDWWTKASGEAFVQRAECVKKQYDNYTAIDDLKVNGAFTLGENVADLGGLKIAHGAMEQWLSTNGGTLPKTRYTPTQQFFVSYAQSWCNKYRPENARMRVKADPHAPPFLRVNGPLGNLPQFKAAFACTDSSRMIRQASEKCEVW